MAIGGSTPRAPVQVRTNTAGPQTQQQLARQPQGGWADTVRAGSFFPAQQSRHPAPQAPSMACPSVTASQTSNLNCNGNPMFYDPSLGPTNTQMPTNFQQRAMQAATMKTNGTQAYRQPVRMPHCKVSGNTKRNFLLGDIITLPYHSANMDRNLNPQNFRLAETCEGWVYSKRRMMIVLWLHADDMFAVPLFTWQGAGLKKKAHAIGEYVAIRNNGQDLPKVDDYGNEMYYGIHEPVEVETRYKDMLPQSSAHLSGGRNVSYSEDIGVVGRATRAGHENLVNLYNEMISKAKKERWRQ